MDNASNQGASTPQIQASGHPRSPAELVDEYLRVLMIPDPAGVQSFIAPGPVSYTHLTLPTKA